MRAHASPVSPALPRRRRAAGGVLLLAVLVAHGLLLIALQPVAPTAPGAPQRAPPLALTAPAASTAPAARLPAAAAPAQAVVDAAVVTPSVSPTPQVLHAALAGTAARAGSKGPPTPPEATAPAQHEPAVAASESAPQAAATGEVPVYATRLPDSATLHYALQRAALTGSAQLSWQRHADGYELSLEGALQGMPVLASSSRGGIDADGVAPLRHAELRRAREVRAANFQREAGRISFSGPRVQYALLPGAQDRLSWMIQLPGIFEADPALARAGTRVTLFVVGARGDAEAWVFEVQGRQALELGAGPVADALHLLREPHRPYDTRVEVWLDPARQHLPVRALLTTLPGGQPLEFTLSHVAGAMP